ncbi:MAG: hypothetical protein IJT90_01520 [Bacteroidaceae bacterium]|nr:hypothetical protein [Bacteroidaceae bacterium]
MLQIIYSGESSAQTYEFTSTTTAPSELSGGTSTSSQTSDVKYIINLSIIRYWEDGTCGEDWAHVKDVYGFQMAGEAVEYAQGVIIDYAAKNLSSYSTERAYLTGDYTIHYYIDSTLQDTIMGHLDVVIPDNPFNTSGITEVVPRVDEFYAYSIEYAAYTPNSGNSRCYIGSMDFYDTFSSAETATVSAENFIDNNIGTDISTTTGETWYATGNYVVYHYEHGAITDSVTGCVSGVTIPNSPYDNDCFDPLIITPYETLTTTVSPSYNVKDSVQTFLEVKEVWPNLASPKYNYVEPNFIFMLSNSALTSILKERSLTSTPSMANYRETLTGDGGISYIRIYTGGYRYVAYDEFGNMEDSAIMQYRTENLLEVKNRCIYITTSEALSSYTAEAQLIINNNFGETTTTTEDLGTISPTGDTGMSLWEWIDWGLDGLALGAEKLSIFPPVKYAIWGYEGYKWLKRGLSNIAETYGEQTKTYSNDIYGLWYQYPSDTLDPIPTIRAKK